MELEDIQLLHCFTLSSVLRATGQTLLVEPWGEPKESSVYMPVYTKLGRGTHKPEGI